MMDVMEIIAACDLKINYIYGIWACSKIMKPKCDIGGKK